MSILSRIDFFMFESEEIFVLNIIKQEPKETLKNKIEFIVVLSMLLLLSKMKALQKLIKLI